MECELFPALQNQRLLLRSVHSDEYLVSQFKAEALKVYKTNIIGPQKYLSVYKKYADLLTGKADQEVTAFVAEQHSLEGFRQVRIFKLFPMFPY